MAVPISVVKLGWSTEPVTLVEWKAKEGERVEKGRPVLVISSEKITADVEAEAPGYLHILVHEDNKAPIGSAVGLLAQTTEELESLQKAPPPKVAADVKEPPNVTTASAQPSVRIEETPPVTPAHARQPSAPLEETRPSKIVAEAEKRDERIRISPVARKLAEEHMIDITKVVGSGPEGRIVREDIEKMLQAKPAPEAAPAAFQGRQLKSTIPLRGMRRGIAEHMHRSLSVSAQLTSMGEIDMTEIMKVRETLVSQAEAIGTRITYTDIFVFVLAKLLREHPIVNSSLIDNEIKLWDSINIGVAVALDEGLIVPVVKDADKKSLVEISKAVRSMTEKAREGNLVPTDVTGGTFTITNLGVLGGGYRFETPIINQPESAIMGTGGITDRAVVRDKQIVIRPIMTYYFTYDHRVINGAVAARFMLGLTQ
ncbi:MAG: 2-oxo acid dehydrogenase subunit E2, partial [Chloroflexi bacterium]|nr:2-oxo acid dehydrogenase subunit E2 [Chloroflexota bacterium]